jgi:hypothetical protein
MPFTIAYVHIAGQTAGSGVFSVMFLFSGFFITKSDIPDYWIWINYLSLFKYTYESMIVNAFTDVNTETLTNKQVMSEYSVAGVNKFTGIGVLILFVIFFRVVFYYRLVTAFNGQRTK